MSQSGSVQQSVSAKPVITGRTGLIQVVPASSTSAGQSLIQHATPLIRSDTVLRNPNNVSSNTAVQYIRKPTAITVLNPANAFVASPVVQPYTTYGTVMSLNPGVIQSLPSSTGLSSSGVNQVSGGTGSALSSLASSRKPCNCTKSHCLKLYCECFAQGQLCQNCNCNNCMNNLGYEEERGRAIKMTLERNPTAFHPKIGRGEGERRHTKGCNCKRSGCLKNYCECYEAKISCSDLCRCQGCRNTEDSVERRSLLRLAAMGSLRSRQPASFKKHLIKPHPETLPHVFFTWEVVEATAGCLLAQAEDAERRDLPPAAQERIVLEEFGRILEHVIDSASKAQIRSSNGLGAGDSEGEVSVLQSGGGPPSYSVRDAVGAATAAAAAADVLLHDDEDEEDEMMREISGMADNDPGDEDMFDDGLGPKSSSRRHLSRHSRRIGRPRRSRSALEIDSEPDSEDEPVRSKHRQSSRTKSRHADVPYRSRRSTAASGRTHDPDDII